MDANMALLTSRAGDSLNLRDPGSVRRALSDRMTFSEALEAVIAMLKFYPPSAADLDQSGYVGALASNLAQYPRCVAVKCTGPVNGLALKCKFKPSVADLVAWCEHETEGLRCIVDRDDLVQATLDRRTQQLPPTAAEKAYVAMRCKDTVEALGRTLGKKSEAMLRDEAEATLARCLTERDTIKLVASPYLLKALRDRDELDRILNQ